MTGSELTIRIFTPYFPKNLCNAIDENSVESIFITSDNLKNIPDNESITHLEFFGKIPIVNRLPPNLVTLNMSGCSIRHIKCEFPESLKYINLSANPSLVNIPKLPPNLEELDIYSLYPTYPEKMTIGGKPIGEADYPITLLKVKTNEFEYSLNTGVSTAY